MGKFNLNYNHNKASLVCWKKQTTISSLIKNEWLLSLIQKSDNLQYNTVGCWVAGTNDSSTKHLMFQVYIFFFHNFLQNSLQKSFQFIFLFFYNFTKIKIKSFECSKSIRNYKKNNAWLTSHLSQRTSEPAYYIVDCRILIC